MDGLCTYAHFHENLDLRREIRSRKRPWTTYIVVIIFACTRTTVHIQVPTTGYPRQAAGSINLYWLAQPLLAKTLYGE